MVRWWPDLFHVRAEISDGVDEGLAVDGHDEIDGIVVSAAAKASSEVCCGVGCRVKVRALGTEKAEVAVPALPWQVKMMDHTVDRNAVSKLSKLCG